MLSWPTIPDPSQDVSNHYNVLRALKDIVELITGQRGGAPAPITRTFATPTQPGAANSPILIRQLQAGDLWIDTGNAAKLNYWDATTKLWIPTT